MDTTMEPGENSRQGFDGLKAAFCLSSMEAKSNVASGLRLRLRRKCVRTRCTGQKRDNETGLDYFGARYYSAPLGRFTSPDPLMASAQTAEPQSWNRYVYTRNNPLNRIDPTGMADFWYNGRLIGDDGIDDDEIYVLKTKKKKFTAHDFEVAGAGMSRKELKETVKYIKNNSGDAEAFQNNGIAYANSIKIESSADVRRSMVAEISNDNGKGGRLAENNSEYGGTIQNGVPVMATPGDIADPFIGGAGISLPTGFPSFHSHPSGTNKGAFFCQFPSRADVEKAGQYTHYVFGRSDGKTYVYTLDAIQAIIPTKNFVTPRQ